MSMKVLTMIATRLYVCVAHLLLHIWILSFSTIQLQQKLVVSEPLWLLLSPPDPSLMPLSFRLDRFVLQEFMSLPIFYFATFILCLQRLSRTCCRSKLPPPCSVVELLFCDGCCPPIISNPILKISSDSNILRGACGAGCFSLSPPHRGLTGKGPEQQLLHAESLPTLLLNLLSPPDGHKCLPGFTHESLFCTMSQFVRITSSGQIHTCEILSQIVNNGEVIKLQDLFSLLWWGWIILPFSWCNCGRNTD